MPGMKEPGSERHASLVRLLGIAREHGAIGPAALAKALNVSEQVVTNWRSRGVSRAGAMAAQQRWGVSANWVLEGKLPRGVGGPVPAPAKASTAEGKELVLRLHGMLKGMRPVRRSTALHLINQMAAHLENSQLAAETAEEFERLLEVGVAGRKS